VRTMRTGAASEHSKLRRCAHSLLSRQQSKQFQTRTCRNTKLNTHLSCPCLRQHGASGQHCNLTSVRAQTAQERCAAQGAGETALVKYRLPNLPYSPKSATGGRHSRNVILKKGGRAATVVSASLQFGYYALACGVLSSCCRCLCFHSSSLCPPLSKELYVGTILHTVPLYLLQDIRLTATRAHDAYGSSIRAHQASTLCSFFAEPSAVEAVPNNDLREYKIINPPLPSLLKAAWRFWAALQPHISAGANGTGSTYRSRGRGNGTSKIPITPTPVFS
jgi:hypothetical protein